MVVTPRYFVVAFFFCRDSSLCYKGHGFNQQS